MKNICFEVKNKLLHHAFVIAKKAGVDVHVARLTANGIVVFCDKNRPSQNNIGEGLRRRISLDVEDGVVVKALFW